MCQWFDTCAIKRRHQVREAYEAAKRDMDASSEGSREAAEAQVGVETSKAMAAAIGVVLV